MRILQKIAQEMPFSEKSDIPKKGLRFKDLTSFSGSARFTNALGGDRHIASEIRDLAASYLKEYPELERIEVGKVDPGGDHFNWSKGQIGLSSGNPDVFSHESAHAGTLQDDSLYRRILKLSKGAVHLNNVAAIPAILSVKNFIRDEKKQDNVLKALAGFSAVAALPNLIEEARASAKAVGKSENKLRAFKSLGPGFLAHVAHGVAAPSAYYLAGK